MTWAPSKKVSSLAMAIIFMASWLHPIWPVEQALHSSLTVVAFVLLWRYLKNNTLSDFHFFLIIVFLAIHSVAAHWLYSNVPYEQWLKALFGFSLQEKLGWTRNHFDRLVHFLYGFCLTPAIIAYAREKWQQTIKVSFVLAISAIMITSLWYEWFEWLVAMTLSAKDAESYNGQQGDMWDAHKDMLLATIGSLVWLRPNGKT